jgi:hypothetical protein
MRLPGSAQVALGKKLLMQYDWWLLEPRPEAARWAPDVGLKEGPWAAAIGDKVRVVYAFAPKPVVVQGLAPNAEYRASHFDPVTGKRKDLGKVRAKADGAWPCPAPDTKHDWVLIVERAP